MLPRTKTVKEDWTRLLEKTDKGAAAQALVDLLGIEQLTKGIAVNVTDSLQGVHVSEPTDYFRRITSEELNPGDLRDQEVLRDIEDWNAGRATLLIDRLVAASDGDHYARVWEHFAQRHTNDQLAIIAAQVAARLLARDKAEAAADHASFIGLWRVCNRRLPRDAYADWLRDLILSALPISLQFVNGLYYYWTGRHGIVSHAARATIRSAIVTEFRNSVRHGDALAGVLTPKHPYQIGRLVTETGEHSEPDTFAAWRDYLAPILIGGAVTQPELVLPEIANLAGDAESGMVAARDDYPPRFINRYRINRERVLALFGDELTNRVLELLAEYKGDNAYVVRAIDEAREWLAERRQPGVAR